MKHLGIKYQILLVTLIPVFLVDLFFTYYHYDSSIKQAEELLQSKGQIIAKQLAGASEFNLISGHDQQIQYMLDQTIDTNAIILASVLDQQGKVVAKSVSEEYQGSNVLKYFYYRSPIASQSMTHSDVFAPDQLENTNDTTIGWVHLYVSRKQLEATKALITQDSIIFFVIILVLFIILTVVISRRITQPVFTLLEHLKNVETGRLGETIEPLASNEIGTVQKGFNRMTQALFSNQKQMNEKIQQATHQLSEAITNMETKNRELGFARDEAQNANTTKSEFLANMSHEFRTPINGIKGFINLMSRSGLNSTQKKYADIILKSTIDLTNIINEILDFSKMESGKLQIVEDDFDLHEIIEQTRDSLFISVLAKNIDLILIIYSDTPQNVCGDKLRIKQILLNLISNAIKFTDQGEVVIRVSLEEQIQTEVTILITIEDTGIGISDEDQVNLFTAFSQIETATNRRFTGTGLGLAISKNLVSLMGGDISLQSEVGKGSIFSVRLPLTLTNTASHDIPEQVNTGKTAMIVANCKTCLQELQSLYDRAGIITEPILLDQQAIEQIREDIQRNKNFIDYLVIDFRQLEFDLTEIIDTKKRHDMRIVAMHYDPDMIPDLDSLGFEFISIINTSKSLRDLLEHSMIEMTEEDANDQQPVTPLHPKNVLFVDDNEINLKLGSELIRIWGHEVCEANHADEAMIQYRQQDFDLIILDIQMPDIDGVTLLTMMREERPQDCTPVVALTANISNQESDRLLGLGFDHYLGKPIDEEKFRALLDGSLERSSTIPVGPVLDQQDGDTESVDIKLSLDLAANNDSLLKQIFEILLREIPHHKDQLSNAMRILDYEKLSMIAHKIHGTTCYACLPRLKSQVELIQQQLAQESYSLLEVTVEAMIEELERVGLQVESYLQREEDDLENAG
jgi:two-component system sensor histidine kinase BarA